ncbi:MAG: hypothetical protein K2L98_03500, partial [Bacilli bacterium]|nr:hypothetical protein [Bacilli bacterium]
IEVKYSNGDVISYKLSFDREYANVDFFLRKEKENSKLNVDNFDSNNTIELQKDVKIAMDKLKESVEIIKVVVDGVDYEVFAIQDGINVKYKENSNEHSYYYGLGNENIFSYKKLFNNKWETIYSANVITNKCEGTKCNQFPNDYNIFVKVINKLIITDTK